MLDERVARELSVSRALKHLTGTYLRRRSLMQLVNVLLTTLALPPSWSIPFLRPPRESCQARVAGRDSASLAACIIQKRFTLFKATFPHRVAEKDNTRGGERERWRRARPEMQRASNYRTAEN